MVTIDTKMVIVIRKDLNMRKGKMISQGAHAAMQFLIENASKTGPDYLESRITPIEEIWLFGQHKKIVVSCKDEHELNELVARAKALKIEAHSVTDNGLTEFHGIQTVTCAAFGPDTSERLDQITGHLQLL